MYIRVEQVETAKEGNKLDFKHIDNNHEDNPKRFNIVWRLNIEIPIIVLIREKCIQNASLLVRAAIGNYEAGNL